MTIIPMFSVTFKNKDHICVELFDREEEAIARHSVIAATGAKVLIQYHTMRVGYGA